MMPTTTRAKAVVTATRALVLAPVFLFATAASSETPAAWTDARTPMPAAPAWSTAEPLPRDRMFGTKANGCAVHRLAEWVRVKCFDMKTAAITQLAGSEADVSYHVEPPGDDRVPGGGQVIFRAQRGDRRVFLFWTLGPGYDGPLTVVPAVVVQEAFLAGNAAPTLVLTEALHEPVATATHPKPPQW